MLQMADGKLCLRGEVLTAEGVRDLRPSWEELCARSVEDNVYYSPRYALALLGSVEKNCNVRFATVWDRNPVALLPFTTAHFPIPLIRPASKAWQSKYTFSCMPLLDRGLAVEAAGALLDLMAATSEGEWLLPTVNVEGEACRAILSALERRGMTWAFTGRFQRASFEFGGSFEEHMDRRVPANRRKNLRRRRRRLEEVGRVEHESHSCGEDLDRAVIAFLELEASGWKGRRGTALACHSDTKAFALAAFSDGPGESICRADLLKLDGKPIAASIIVKAGSTGFAVKNGLDETYSTYAPGLLLDAEVLNSFLTERWASRLDAATAGAHAFDDLWEGRVEVADLIFSLAPRGAELRLHAVKRTQEIRRSASAALKPLVEWLRGVCAHRGHGPERPAGVLPNDGRGRAAA